MCEGRGIVKSPEPNIDNQMWATSFLRYCNYQQCEKNHAIRRVYLKAAYCATIIVDPSSNPNGAYRAHMKALGEPDTPERARALIQMLEYNYPARAHGPGCMGNRNLDIEYIKQNWLN